MMAIHNTRGADLTVKGYLSCKELARIIIDAYNNDKLDDLINRESVELTVLPVDSSTHSIRETVKLPTQGIWDIEQWITEVQQKRYDLNNGGDRCLVEVFLIRKIRDVFPDDYSHSKLPIGYKWASPTNDS